jgi:hypothetical protein
VPGYLLSFSDIFLIKKLSGFSVSKTAHYLHKQGNGKTAREVRRQFQRLPARDPADPGFRRLRYCRYADDFLLGFIGPKIEAEEIKQAIGAFLREELTRIILTFGEYCSLACDGRDMRK